MISDDFVDKLRTQADIAVVVSEYVPLQKKGRRYWGCCPFHAEKTPSFSVAPDKGLFYCFGCQAGGDIFHFLQRMENIGFAEAIKLLAEKLNIPVPERERTEAERQRERDREDILRANAMARDFFHACLTRTKLGAPARDYLSGRGVSEEMVLDWKLGFAPDSWDKMSVALQTRGITEQTLIKAGLSSARAQGGVFDRFRNRIMFPIEDIRERVVGFGGRVMDNSQPKYLNSPETAVFNKRTVLYNISRAFRAIKESGRAIVVEGYMDALSLSGSGITNVVASMGTSFTPEQSRILQHFAPEIVFAYDGDAAGQNATLRALSIVRAGGAVVKVATFPDGKDPDEAVRRLGAPVVKERLSAAVGLLEFQMEQALRESDHTDLAGKVAVVNRAVPYLALAENAVEVDAHIARLAERLGIDENSIRSELRRHRGRKEGVKPAVVQVRRSAESKQSQAEGVVIRCAIGQPEHLSLIRGALEPGHFQDGPARSVADAIWKAGEEGRHPRQEELLRLLDDAAVRYLSRVMMGSDPGQDVPQALDDCIRTLRVARLQEEFEKHSRSADEMLNRGDSQYVQELMNAQRILTKISDITKSQG